MSALTIKTKAERDFDWFAKELNTTSKLKTYFLNPLDIGFLWAKNINGSQSPTEAAVHSGVVGVRRALALPSFIIATNSLVNNVMGGIRAQDRKEKILKSVSAVDDLCDMGSAVSDFSRGLNQIKAINLSPAATTALSGLSNTTLFVGSAIGIAKSSVELADSVKKVQANNLPAKEIQHEKQKINRSSISLVRSICFIAMAIIGLVSMIFMPFISPFIGLSLFTTAVGLSLSKVIYEKVVDYKE